MATLAPELIIDTSIQSQVDGNTNTFDTALPFIPGTMTMYWNGQSAVHGKGIVELSPTSFSIEPDIHGQPIYPAPEDNVWVTGMA